jgi:hypothetical protein
MAPSAKMQRCGAPGMTPHISFITANEADAVDPVTVLVTFCAMLLEAGFMP